MLRGDRGACVWGTGRAPSAPAAKCDMVLLYYVARWPKATNVAGLCTSDNCPCDTVAFGPCKKVCVLRGANSMPDGCRCAGSLARGRSTSIPRESLTLYYFSPSVGVSVGSSCPFSALYPCGIDAPAKNVTMRGNKWVWSMCALARYAQTAPPKKIARGLPQRSKEGATLRTKDTRGLYMLHSVRSPLGIVTRSGLSSSGGER